MRGFWSGAFPLAAAIITSALLVQADEPVAGGAIIVDADGQEHLLTQIKFGAGTKRLAWLADPQGTTDDAKKGPLALEFREPNSTTLVKGVTTLVPVASIESMVFDHAKQEVTLAVKGLQQRLVGILGYQRVNVLGINGLNDGKAVTFTGGTSGKSAIKRMSFGGAQPPLKSKTHATWNVQIVQPKANNPTVVVRNLKVLIAQSGGARNWWMDCPFARASRLRSMPNSNGWRSWPTTRSPMSSRPRSSWWVRADDRRFPTSWNGTESRGRSSAFSGRSTLAGSSSRCIPSSSSRHRSGRLSDRGQ